MNELYKIYFIVCFCIIEVIVNFKNDNCFNKLKGVKYIVLWINIIIHAIIVSILLLGWIINNKWFLKFYIL